jgi:hypothetical protein
MRDARPPEPLVRKKAQFHVRLRTRLARRHWSFILFGADTTYNLGVLAVQLEFQTNEVYRGH